MSESLGLIAPSPKSQRTLSPPEIIEVPKRSTPVERKKDLSKEFELNINPGQHGLHVYVQQDDPFSNAVLIALEEMKLPYDVTVLSLQQIQSDEFSKYNRRRRAPLLVSSGGVVLHEVIAILSYLAINYPTSPAAFPAEKLPLARTITRLNETRHLFQVATDAMKLLSQPDWLESKEKTKIEQAIHNELSLWDSYVEGDFILGSEVSLVDAAVYPILKWFHLHDPSCLDKYPNLKQFHTTFSTRITPDTPGYTPQ